MKSHIRTGSAPSNENSKEEEQTFDKKEDRNNNPIDKEIPKNENDPKMKTKSYCVSREGKEELYGNILLLPDQEQIHFNVVFKDGKTEQYDLFSPKFKDEQTLKQDLKDLLGKSVPNMECIENIELTRMPKNYTPTVEPRRVCRNPHMIPFIPPTSAEVCIGTPGPNGNLTTFVS